MLRQKARTPLKGKPNLRGYGQGDWMNLHAGYGQGHLTDWHRSSTHYLHAGYGQGDWMNLHAGYGQGRLTD